MRHITTYGLVQLREHKEQKKNKLGRRDFYFHHNLTKKKKNYKKKQNKKLNKKVWKNEFFFRHFIHVYLQDMVPEWRQKSQSAFWGDATNINKKIPN